MRIRIILTNEDKIRIVEFITAFVALAIGGLIYVLYRSDNLLMFEWFQRIGISNIIRDMRENTETQNLYGWVKNSMPAGLWLLSYLFVIDSIWWREKHTIYYIFIYVLPFLAICSEFLQFFGIMPGTFDISDLLSYVLAFLLFIIIKKIQL